MTPISATRFRKEMFQLLEQAVRTGQPVIIWYTRTRGVKGKPKTRWYKIEPIPE
jgi:hypothetical protein